MKAEIKFFAKLAALMLFYSYMVIATIAVVEGFSIIDTVVAISIVSLIVLANIASAFLLSWWVD